MNYINAKKRQVYFRYYYFHLFPLHNFPFLPLCVICMYKRTVTRYVTVLLFYVLLKLFVLNLLEYEEANNSHTSIVIIIKLFLIRHSKKIVSSILFSMLCIFRSISFMFYSEYILHYSSYVSKRLWLKIVTLQ